VAAVNAALLLAVALIAELVFGAWVKAPGLWTLSIQRDFAIRGWQQEKYLRDAPMLYSRDYYGFRGNSHALEAINIIAMGGSTTDKVELSDQETWTAQLQQCLVSRGAPAKIANAGINGQSGLGHIRNFDVWLGHLPDLRPKYLLIYVGINETKIEGSPENNRFNDDVTFRDKAGAPNMRHGAGTIERYTAAKVLGDWITINSTFYSLYRIAWGNLQAIAKGWNPRWNAELYYDAPKRGVFWKSEQSTFSEIEVALLKKSLSDQAINSMDKVEIKGRTGAGAITEYFKNTKKSAALKGAPVHLMIAGFSHDNRSRLSNFARRLKKLSEKTKDFGADPIFITQPKGSYRIRGDRIIGSVGAYIKLAAYNRVLMDFCRAEFLDCIDLGSELEFQDGDFWDSEHTTLQGSARIGRYLCGKLLTGKYLRRS
jgi:hypothetical protein